MRYNERHPVSLSTKGNPGSVFSAEATQKEKKSTISKQAYLTGQPKLSNHGPGEIEFAVNKGLPQEEKSSMVKVIAKKHALFPHGKRFVVSCDVWLEGDLIRVTAAEIELAAYNFTITTMTTKEKPRATWSDAKAKLVDLDRTALLELAFGWGVGDALNELWREAGLEIDS